MKSTQVDFGLARYRPRRLIEATAQQLDFMTKDDERCIGTGQPGSLSQNRRIEPHIGFMRSNVVAEGQVGVQAICPAGD